MVCALLPLNLKTDSIERAAMEISLTETHETDEISIRTRFSDYSFRVIDPRLCRGLLSGGVLGIRARNACLVGTILPTNHHVCLGKQLEIGVRAVFLVAGIGLDGLITSVITQLTLSTSQDSQRLA